MADEKTYKGVLLTEINVKEIEQVEAPSMLLGD